MKLFPAIDVKNGHCVKIRQGQFHDTEVYSHTPAKIAKNFELQGASGINIVDLNGVFTGHLVNDSVIRDIVQSVSIPVQMGGGIRTIKDIEYALILGVEQVIIGTKAVENPAFVKDAVSIFGADKIIIAIDVINGMVAVDGWEKITTYNPVSFAKKMEKYGIQAVIYKEVNNGNNHHFVNADIIKELVSSTDLQVMVAGGINNLKHLEVLSQINVYGAILGKALYENKIELKNAIDLFEDCEP